ncbi:hypothetical protein [Bacillus cereus group sp. BfR-BA-01380]|uniref:hypothetical protein n=1 Tax=Bacillus cereus group sp. BfR-BA-01380 TaxID=2920324 RepID=UPI001F5682BB|nr:hypothetical protein [Bacillus cereus group sp. BfR-BA-01380]
MKKLEMTIAGLVLTGGIMAFNVMPLNKGDLPSPQRPALAYNIGDGGGIISNKSVGDHGGSPSYGHADFPLPQA